ncbi:unnamed protein product [Anisakis simplex]|uniref:DUF3338 domain-containing protein n=1 Tax=Anisakis simplex TaxID=6269 RepID=A0A0M3JDP7_ANISI|nr:unnamed protein product [Anisakis simplex]
MSIKFSLDHNAVLLYFSEKSEEEKQKDIELYRELKQRKNELEEKLLAKLEELREVCIKEAEITGEMPKEIYKTLMPGEPEPKVKRRVGTAFCLSEDVFRKPADGVCRFAFLLHFLITNSQLEMLAGLYSRDLFIKSDARRVILKGNCGFSSKFGRVKNTLLKWIMVSG